MINFDNSATSFPKPLSVRRACAEALERYGGNPGRSGHKLSLRAAEKVYETRSLAARMFGAEPENTALTANCTYALNMAIKGIMQYGGHIIISPYEHNSVARPVHRLTETSRVNVSIGKVYDDDDETVKAFEELINEKTKCICVTAASNVTGRVLPLKKLGELCRKHGICFIVDGAQACGVQDIKLSDGINLICTAGHKSLYGPSGTGLLITDGEFPLSTIIEGGTGATSAELIQTPTMPEKLESGTVNTVGIIGLGEGIKFVQRRGLDRIKQHEENLCKRFVSGVSGVRGIRFYEGDVKKLPIVAFNIGDIPSEQVASALSEKGFALRGGLQCAPLAHKTIGTLAQGTVRFSPSVFNTEQQVDRLVSAVKGLAV
ncbi:MAG: aminotransferase class V-fold PLP-dependent enzyme [Ruminococcus sp.]|nr:aminotransferase class V-fold PLP-dependent enzyme [Ruminococcus sp.]